MKKLILLGCTASLLTLNGTHAQELTQTQSAELLEVGQSLSHQTTVYEGLIKNKLTELALELQREDRLESEKSAKEAAKRADKIMTELGQLYGGYIKTKVTFILEAKNVLTDEQKLMLLSQIKPDRSMPYDSISYLQPDIFDLPLNLTIEQEKKLIKLEAELLKKEIDIERDVELALLDVRVILLSGQPQPEKMDPLMMKLADLAAESINNRVSIFLKSKDVLTLDQKRLLSHMLELN